MSKEAKAEYMYSKKLISILTVPVYNKLNEIYERVLLETQNKQEVLINFQLELKKIRGWNQDEINAEVDVITNECEWISDLINAVFISNVKILTSLKLAKDKKKLQITMPKTDIFVHGVYKTTACSIFENPFVFQSQNRKAQVTPIIQSSIEDTIRTMLPFQNILQKYLGSTLKDDDSSSSESDSDEEPEEPEEPQEAEEPEEPEEPEELEEPEEPPELAEEPCEDTSYLDPPSIPPSGEFPISQPPVMSEQVLAPPVHPPNSFFAAPEETKNIEVQPQPGKPPVRQSAFFRDAVEH